MTAVTEPATSHRQAPTALAILLAAVVLLAPAACAPPKNGDGNVATENENVGPELPPADPSLVTFTWTPPLPEYAARKQYTASLLVSSPRNVSSVKLDGTEVGTPGTREFTLPITFDLAAGADHTVTIDVEAASVDTDPLPSPFAETSVSITLDEERPTIELVAPAWPEDEVPTVTSAFADVSLRVGDNVRIEKLTAYGKEIEVTSSAQLMTTLELAQGRQTVAFEATDPAGNTTRLERTIIVDSMPPSIDLTSPVSGLTAFRVDGDEVELRGQVRDPSGVESLEIQGTTVSLTGPEHQRSFSNVRVALEEGTNEVECKVRDLLGNSGVITLTIISGALNATEPTPEGLEVPPAPDDSWGVRTGDASADGADPESALRNLQLASMARLLAETWAVRPDLVMASPALREFALAQHVEFDGWQRTTNGWFVAGRIVVAEDDLFDVVGRHAADLTPPDRQPDPVERLFTHPASGTLDAVGATDDHNASMVLVTRDAGRVSVHRLFGGKPFGRLDSALTWDRVTAARLVGPVVFVVGYKGDQQQFEVFRETPEPQPSPDGGVAFHPTEPVLARKSGTTVEVLQLPDMTVNRTLTVADADVRLVGFNPDGNLLALGTTTDEFGVRLPGMLLVIDGQTGETLSALNRLDALLGSRDLIEPSLDDSDLVAVTNKLNKAVNGVMSADANTLLLTLADAALPLDPRTGAITGPVFPDPGVAATLGAPLVFEPSADGTTIVIRGTNASMLMEMAGGRQLAAVREGRIVLSSVGGVLLVQRDACMAVALDAVTRRVASPSVTPDVICGVGDRLRLQIRARLGEEIDEPLATHGRPALAAWLRANGYELATDENAADATAMVRVESWVRDDILRVRVTLAATDQSPPRLLLGTREVTRDGDESMDDLLVRLFRELRSNLAPVPSRVCDITDAAHDLPLNLSGNQKTN